MRFLIDNALSPHIAEKLEAAGYQAVHVRDVGLVDAPDDQIFNKAIAEQLIIISADTDFGTLLSFRNETTPSVILFRGEAFRRPDQQVTILLDILPKLEVYLLSGSVVVITKEKIRIRQLPIKG